MTAEFFSFAGRTSPARFAMWVAATVVLLWAGARALEVGGLAMFLVVGAIWGALAAKLGAESARRMRDQGHRGVLALPVIGLAMLAGAALMLRWLASGPDTLFTIGMIVIALGLGAACFRPGVASASARRPSSAVAGTSAALVAVSLTLVGMGRGYGLFAWSEGVRHVHEENARRAAAYRAGPDPLAHEYRAQGGHP